VYSQPYEEDVVITRGASAPSTQHGTSADGRVAITLRIKNESSLKRAITDVVVTDTLPEGFTYEWGSEKCFNNNEVDDNDIVDIVVVGSNPYRFHIGNLEYGATKILTYRAIRLNEKE
jgi:hypothetical protein